MMILWGLIRLRVLLSPAWAFQEGGKLPTGPQVLTQPQFHQRSHNSHAGGAPPTISCGVHSIQGRSHTDTDKHTTVPISWELPQMKGRNWKSSSPHTPWLPAGSIR